MEYIKFTKENRDKVLEFVNFDMTWTQLPELIPIDTDKGRIWAKLGDYITKDDSGNISIEEAK